MHTSLRLGGRHTLYAMYARFIFQRAIYIITRYGADDFLETAGCAFVGAGYIQFPAFCLAILGVHTEEVAGKDGGFVSTCAATDFKYCVTAILRVGRHKQQLYLFFQLRLACLAGIKFFTGHFTHLGIGFVGDDFFRFLNAVQHLHVFLAGIHQVTQFFVFFGKLDIALLVGNHCRVGYQCGYFFEAGNEAFQFLKYGIVICHLIQVVML